MILPVDDIGQFGLVVDVPFDKLPLNAWTDAKNVRFRAGVAEKFFGHSAVFGSPLNSPEWLLHTTQAASTFWLYASGTKVGATDGVTHADITRLSGDYSPLPKVGWTGGVIEGIPVINNGADVPQMWNTPALSTRLADLTAWPANTTCRTMRALKRYLVALDVTKTGTRYPTMIKWSHQAPTGAVPTSWDHTSDKVDAGEYVLPEEGGFLVDMVPLRDVGILYRESQTWQMQYVGGIDVFRFTRLFEHIGVLARDCAVEFFSGKHVVFTGDDIVLVEGVNAKSLISQRLKKAINIDLTNYDKSFVVADYNNTEVLVCFPEPGRTWASKALVWNWISDSWGIRELPDVGFIATGIVNEGSSSDTWNSAVGVWDTDNVAWGDRTSDPTKKRLLLSIPGSPGSLHAMGLTQQFAGVDMQAYVERRAIGFPTKSGQPPDYTRMKQVLALWPRITGTDGGSLSVSIGIQQRVGGPVTWSAAKSYVIGSSDMLDFSDMEASRLHALRIESNGNISWTLSGYDVELIDRGRH